MEKQDVCKNEIAIEQISGIMAIHPFPQYRSYSVYSDKKGTNAYSAGFFAFLKHKAFPMSLSAIRIAVAKKAQERKSRMLPIPTRALLSPCIAAASPVCGRIVYI